MSELRDLLAAEGGLIADALGPDTTDEAPLAIAAVREGQRLHAGAPRVVTKAVRGTLPLP